MGKYAFEFHQNKDPEQYEYLRTILKAKNCNFYYDKFKNDIITANYYNDKFKNIYNNYK